MSLTNNEMKIALVGLAGVLFTGVVSNIDKISNLFAQEEVSEDIDVYLREFVELSGMRASLEAIEKNKANQYRLKYQVSKDVANCMIDLEVQSSQLIDVFLTAMKKHTSLQEVKDMNNFYSTPSMKKYMKEQPAIMNDFATGLEDLYERINTRNGVISNTADEICPDSNAVNLNTSKSKK